MKIKYSKFEKFMYLLLVSAIVFVVVMASDKISNNRASKQRLYEIFVTGGDYVPFNGNNKLAVLDDESEFKLTENLPILDGASSFQPIYAAFVQAVYPSNKDYGDRSSILLRSRTATAYNNLLNGKVDLIFCLEPSERQLQQFRDNNINLKLIPIGKEAFVFFVHKKNKVKNLSIENIHGIYSGKVNKWNELKGQNKKIIAYQRDIDSGSQTILEKIMGDIPITIPPLLEISSGMGAMLYEVTDYTNYNNAMGYSFLHYATEMVRNDKIKLLSINGIYPSVETIMDNSYPFTVDFYAIYNDTEDKNKNIEPFIEWILSGQGQSLIFKTGYAPIN